MSRPKKTEGRILDGRGVANIPFADLCALMRALSFSERIKGSHHIFTRTDVQGILNLQPNRDGKAKPYQVKQVREILLRYGGLEPSDDEV